MEAAGAVDQFAGTGGLLGSAALARQAREVQTLLLDRRVHASQVRESLTNRLVAYNTPGEALDNPVPDVIVQTLSGKCVAVVGLPAPETQRLCVALERARARAMPFELASPPDSASVAHCDLVLTYVDPGGGDSAWLDPSSIIAGRPSIFVGHRDDLLALNPAVQAMATEFLMDSWQPEQALGRLCLARGRSKYHKGRHAKPVAAGAPLSVLAAV